MGSIQWQGILRKLCNGSTYKISGISMFWHAGLLATVRHPLHHILRMACEQVPCHHERLYRQ